MWARGSSRIYSSVEGKKPSNQDYSTWEGHCSERRGRESFPDKRELREFITMEQDYESH